mgnify:CR=1 FL=1
MTADAVPSRLVVLACFAPAGEPGPQLRLQVEAWHGACSRLIVVSAGPLHPEARRWLSERAELIERDNRGYDFASYATGLRAAGDLSGYAEVVLCNDSFVGPLRPYPQLFAEMAGRPVDFWGITTSRRIDPHVQSYFLVFRSWVVASPAFATFWAELAVLSQRRDVIRRYEVGLSQTLLGVGFAMGSYFEPSPAERRRARLRTGWWISRRSDAPRRLRELIGRSDEPWNPTYALADSALPDGRLPVVKLDALRFDPYGLDAARLLRACERSFPAQFDGVADYLERTAEHYPPRAGEQLRRPRRLLAALQPLVRYR